MYDLVIKGGTLVDARHNRETQRDVAVEAGQIAEVAPEIAAGAARECYDATGKLVMPGIIDTEVHIPSNSGPTAAHRQLARAGVTTALDFANFRGVIADLPRAGAGITVGGIQVIGPYADRVPSAAEVDDQIEGLLREGALGIKVLGGHYPSTPEATALMIERGNQAGTFVGYHCGTTTAPSTLEGLKQAPELIGQHSVQIAHINAYLRGANADIVTENLEALRVLQTIPWVVTESHLFSFNGCSGECIGDVPRDQITRNCLRLHGYAETRAGIRQAFLDGYCHANVQVGEGFVQFTSEDGLRYWEESGTRQGLSFPVNSRVSALMTTTARLTETGLAFEGDGQFIVDTLTSDGGRWRNVILEKGLELVDFGFMTLQQFIYKACDLPAQVLALSDKGHLGEGADADLIVVDRGARRVDLTVASGKVIQMDGVVIGSGATILTTKDGAERVSELHLPSRVIEVTRGYLYNKGRGTAA